MSNGFKNTEDKRTKASRLWLCTLFATEIMFLAMPYIATTQDGQYISKTMFELILGINATDVIWVKMAAIALCFAIVPIVGFFFAVFDKKSCVKCFVGCVCAFTGICGLTFVLPQFSSVLAIGAMLALVIYLFIFVLCVSLTLKIIGIRALEKQKEQEIRERNEA
ncbi:MAG: hypothetical protein UH241_08870 [Acutalibacteraceae bacterium]|nr:hypothetical protein [Acutalibacteraceae bacterium]